MEGVGVSTNISWTDVTWNPVTGCSRVSEGCRNCYAAKLAPRLAGMGQKGYTKLPWTKKNAPENVFLHSERLDKPLKWKKPRRVFVNSMSDLFHEQVPDAFIRAVWSVMEQTPQHTYQILTKRPERMASLCGAGWVKPFCPCDAGHPQDCKPELEGGAHSSPLQWRPWLDPRHPSPLPNVWLGVSVEDQRAADERIPHLLNTPAAVRFLSCEPLIGPVDLTRVNFKDNGLDPYRWDYRCYWRDFLNGASYFGDQNGDVDTEIPRVDWVIAGGESGPGYRPMDPAWPRALRDQCVKAGVPFFFKQWGGKASEGEASLDGREWREMPVREDA